MHSLEILELSRIIQRERLQEAERDRTYRRLRQLQQQRQQPHTARPRTRRLRLSALHLGWRTA